MALYLSYWYVKRDLAKRISVFVGAGAVSVSLHNPVLLFLISVSEDVGRAEGRADTSFPCEIAGWRSREYVGTWNDSGWGSDIRAELASECSSHLHDHTTPFTSALQILFLVEGLPSILLSLLVLLFLPSLPSTSTYLTPSDRSLLLHRLHSDSQGENQLGIDWSGVRRALGDWKTYVVAGGYSCLNFGLGSVSGFLPTIGESRSGDNTSFHLELRGRPC